MIVDIIGTVKDSTYKLYYFEYSKDK